MNSKLKKLLTAMLLTAMILPIVPVLAPPSETHSDSIWLEPDGDPTPLTGGAGTIFNILCWANVSALGFTYQVKITWDNTILQCNSFSHTAGDVSGEDWLDQRDPGPNMMYEATSLPGPVFDTNWGKLGGTCAGDDFVPANTVGMLCKAQFEVIGAPEKYGSLDTYISVDNADTYILDTGLGEPSITKYDSHYHYDWEYPPSPNMAVRNATGGTLWRYGPDPPNATGELFDVPVYIEDLDANWNLHNATFALLWNTTIINMTAIVFDPLWATTSAAYTGGIPDRLDVEVKDPTSTPFGDVLVCTITFNVTYQDIAPPRPVGDSDDSPLDLTDIVLFDTIEEIPQDPEVDGLVKIFCVRVLPLPWFEVSSVTMGPGPARGERFNVTVSLMGVDWSWLMISGQFRLAYDPALINPVMAYEGPFFQTFAAMQPGSLGTFYSCFFETNTMWGPHVVFGSMVLPNSTGWWHGPWPNGSDVMAIIEFEVVYQSFGDPDATCDLEIIENLGVGLSNQVDQEIVDVPMDFPVNGVYWITTDWPGRVIDVYGGALNEGWGSHPFPAPYGGQGPNNPMDLVVPQSEVCLFAEVTYNYWPVQSKLVGFEVNDPQGEVLLKRTAITNEVGIAMICFEMPWPCDDPESLFGVWTVTTTVSISDVRVNDTLEFHYDYLVNIFKVTTDKFEYDHCDDVCITIEYGTHAQQWYPLLLSVLLMDELIVPVGFTTIETEIGGAEFCSYTNFTECVSIHVVKHAFAGLATIHVNAYDFDPTEGGVAWCPEYTPAPVIAIQPF